MTTKRLSAANFHESTWETEILTEPDAFEFAEAYATAQPRWARSTGTGEGERDVKGNTMERNEIDGSEASKDVVVTSDGTGEVCKNCGQAYVCWFTESEIWNKAIPESGMLCPNCFLARAERAGITQSAWKIIPDDTGTGEGSELGWEFFEQAKELGAICEKLRPGTGGAIEHFTRMAFDEGKSQADAALRSQLEEAAERISDLQAQRDGLIDSLAVDNKRAEKAERDLATAQARIARAEDALRAIQRDYMDFNDLSQTALLKLEAALAEPQSGEK